MGWFFFVVFVCKRVGVGKLRDSYGPWWALSAARCLERVGGEEVPKLTSVTQPLPKLCVVVENLPVPTNTSQTLTCRSAEHRRGPVCVSPHRLSLQLPGEQYKPVPDCTALVKKPSAEANSSFSCGQV